MARYVLTKAAQQDLIAIRAHYLDRAGPRIARQMLAEFVDAFRFLARNPAAGHRREDLAQSRPILFWPMRDYLILYKTSTRPLQVLAILHGKQDLPRIVKSREE